MLFCPLASNIFATKSDISFITVSCNLMCLSPTPHPPLPSLTASNTSLSIMCLCVVFCVQILICSVFLILWCGVFWLVMGNFQSLYLQISLLLHFFSSYRSWRIDELSFSQFLMCLLYCVVFVFSYSISFSLGPLRFSKSTNLTEFPNPIFLSIQPAD